MYHYDEYDNRYKIMWYLFWLLWDQVVSELRYNAFEWCSDWIGYIWNHGLDKLGLIISNKQIQQYVIT